MSPLNYNDDTFTSLPEDFAGHYRIPKGIKTIGNRAFAHCRYLKSIDIPEDVKSIGNGAFMGCENLEEITIPEGVKSIGDGTFLGCYNLKEVTIPKGVISIGNEAFAFCRNLKEIIIPKGVTSIGNEAFSWCINLKEITIPQGVTSIGNEAFSWCTNLEEITIPSSLTKVEEDFLDYTSFSKDEIEPIRAYIHNNNDKAKTENRIFTHTTQEANKAVSECGNKDTEKIENQIYIHKDKKNIKKCTIPKEFSSIGGGAFKGYTALTQIEIPSSVTEIGFLTFQGCSKLTQIEIPSSVTKVGDSAFEGCSALTQIEIPSSVTKVGNTAFKGCSELQRIAILGNSTSIDWPLFENCTSLEKVVIQSSRYILEKGLVYNKAKTELFECINTLCDTNVVIDPKVRIIHSRAFHNLKNITSITLPKNLTIIEGSAFNFSNSEVNLIVQTERMEQIKVYYGLRGSFKDLGYRCSLTVPIGTGYAYRHHPVWEEFKTINVASFNYEEESVVSDSEETR